MESYRLYEVNEYIRRVIALNFDEPIWIECEINQISEKRGHYYLDLIEKSEETEEVIAKSRASIWFRQASFIKKKLGKLFEPLLSSGNQVKLKVVIEFHEKFGMNLIIEDVDPAYTLGQVEMNRQKIIERLKEEELLYRNQLLELPSVLQKIAIISSETAAGYKDFVAQLQNNAYGYAFQLFLFDAAVQGQRMDADITSSLREIQEDKEDYDLIVIIRGGGSKLDLSGFDSYNIAAHIAKCKYPVITGIGHEIDQTVSDLTAHTSLKTPTAVAGFIIDKNLHFESIIIERYHEVRAYILAELAEHHNFLENGKERIGGIIKASLTEQLGSLNYVETGLKLAIQSSLQNQYKSLDFLDSLLEVQSPENILKKGYNYTTEGKKFIKSKVDALAAKQLEIHYFDGSVKAKPINNEK